VATARPYEEPTAATEADEPAAAIGLSAT
jgi:hypothetical protein